MCLFLRYLGLNFTKVSSLNELCRFERTHLNPLCLKMQLHFLHLLF